VGSNPIQSGRSVDSGQREERQGRRLERSGEEGRTNLTQSRRVNRGVAERMPDEGELTIGDGACNHMEWWHASINLLSEKQ